MYYTDTLICLETNVCLCACLYSDTIMKSLQALDGSNIQQTLPVIEDEHSRFYASKICVCNLQLSYIIKRNSHWHHYKTNSTNHNFQALIIAMVTKINYEGVLYLVKKTNERNGTEASFMYWTTTLWSLMSC